MGYQPVDRAGSHLKLRYVHPETGEIRNVTIPLGKEVSGDTLRNIADQCGANDFQSWCAWIDELL
nr:type II toxin-antitoxin system HicA family toxin [Halomicroarcula sp. GDY20]